MAGNILGIIGVILTICFGIYSIWIYRKSKKRITLLFKNLECYTLFAPDINRLNIELLYNKEPIKNNLILLKAALINKGNIDIDKNRIFKPLRIITEKNYKWVQSKLTSFPEGARTEIQVVNKNEIQIEWDLLKSNEIIEFESIVEIEDQEIDYNTTIDFINKLKFDYRITDLHSITKEKIESLEDFIEGPLIKSINYLPWIILLAGLYFTISNLFPKYNIFKENYKIEFAINDSLRTTDAILNPTTNDKIFIENNISSGKLSIQEFNSKYKILSVHRLIVNRDGKTHSLFLYVFMIIAGIVLIILFKKNK